MGQKKAHELRERVGFGLDEWSTAEASAALQPHVNKVCSFSSTQLARIHRIMHDKPPFLTADIRLLLFAQAADGICSQEIEQKNQVPVAIVPPLGLARRLLSGPGSSPPRCISKCGNCTPCKPVHVSVPPGTPVTAEYYPEAWRCKCGNKLYMP
ncbi:hypothetical protein V6N13_001204 [Hibiscus sabdariffa]